MQEDFIDRIYEASFVPEMWPKILEELGTMTDSVGGLLLSTRDKTLTWTASQNIYGAFADYLSEGWFRRCGRRVCIMDKAQAEFLREHDYWTDEEIAENEIYQKFFRPRDLGCSAGTGFITPNGDAVVFSIERSHTLGPIESAHVELLNTLRPHLARSAMVAARMGLKNASTANEVFSRLGLPTILLNRDGVALEASENVDDLKEALHLGALNRVTLNDAEANALLYAALEDKESQNAVHSFPIRDEAGRAVGVGHLLPVSKSAHDVFSQGFAIFVVNPVSKRAAPSVDLLRSLFDLTASEAKVARLLAAGVSTEEIAAQGEVSVNTIRTQIRKIMEKTGSSRQPEVVSLISNLTVQQKN